MPSQCIESELQPSIPSMISVCAFLFYIYSFATLFFLQRDDLLYGVLYIKNMKYIYIVSFLPSSTTVYVTKKGSCRHNLLTIKYFSTVVDFTTLQVRYFVCRTSKLCSSRVKVAVAMCAVTRSKLVKVRASNTDSQYIYIVEKYLLEAGFVIQRSTPQPTTNFTSSLV